MVHIDWASRRVWILKARLHHGLVGVGLVLGGTLLIVHDWADKPWLKDG